MSTINEKEEEMKPEIQEESQTIVDGDNEKTSDETVESEESKVESEVESEVVEEKQEPSLEEQLAAANKQIEELKTAALYKAAEFDNFRKNMMKEKSNLIKLGGENIMKAILPIIDDFERAEDTMDKAGDVDALKEGVRLIIDKFLKLLATEGLQKIDCVGKEFDTNFHEAVAMVPGLPETEKNKVIDCIQNGYTMHDKVIRYAKVAVAQ